MRISRSRKPRLNNWLTTSAWPPPSRPDRGSDVEVVELRRPRAHRQRAQQSPQPADVARRRRLEEHRESSAHRCGRRLGQADDLTGHLDGQPHGQYREVDRPVRSEPADQVGAHLLDHRLVALDHRRGEEPGGRPALLAMPLALEVEDRRKQILRRAHAFCAEACLPGGVRCAQNLPRDRERADHPGRFAVPLDELSPRPASASVGPGHVHDVSGRECPARAPRLSPTW